MVNAQLQGVLRHLEGLRDAQVLTEAPDAWLLEWFVHGHEEAPFAALVRRHGPMVWAVSQRVLPHVHDAEDVFQATFLLLARKAASIRKAESVGSWLHGVAHRLALQLRLQQVRRQSREKRAADMQMNRSDAGTPLSEMQTALDTALQELPEKYRAALVLCYLEGNTQEETARQLGCPLATVRTRVARGRKLLRDRLVKKGLTLSTAGLASLLIASAAPAAAPAAVMKAAVQAALPFAAGQSATALCSKQMAGLVEGGLQTMFLTKVKTATAVLLAASLVASAAALTQRGTVASEAAILPAKSADSPGAEAKPPVAADKDGVAYGGRVLGPDGKPVAGAMLFLTRMHNYYREPFPAAQQATTGSDGRFDFTMPSAKFGAQKTVVAALAANHGVGWVEVPADAKRDGLTLRLVDDSVPITGQVVDLEGKPVAGAALHVLGIRAAPGNNLGPWLEAVRGKKAESMALQSQESRLEGIDLSQLSLKVRTDAEGRFRLTGIGRDRLVRAQLDGPTIASQYLHLITRAGKTLEVAEWKGKLPPTITYYAPGFRYVAAPTKPVIGVVRDKDTGKPLAGVTVESNQLANDPIPGRNIIQTTTDAQGRYRLTGLPKGEGNKIRLVPRADQPYVSVHAVVPDSPGLDPVIVDFQLKRGIWIEGKLTDKVTGLPVKGSVDYFALDNNPNVGDHPGFDGTIPPFWGVETKEDGSFRVVGLPGPGLIAVFYNGRHLLVPDRDDEYGTKESVIYTSPRQLGLLINYTALARIDPAKGVDLVKRDITLDPGWTFTGTVLGQDGQPLAGARSFGLTDRGWSHEVMKTAEFKVKAFNPRRPRDVFFQHLGNGLVGVAPPPKENGGSVTVRLEPGATIKGRLVDAGGKPRAGVELDVWFGHKGKSIYFDGSEYSPERIKTDQEGRFRIEALLPGYEFRLKNSQGELHLGALRSGQTKDLGDVQLKGEE
jgi:RNA polymerase sigma factor (sigma-70 family)